MANVSGFSVEDYAYTCEKLDKEAQVGWLEVNVSCPNVHGGGMSFGTSPEAAAEVTRAVKKVTQKPVIIKLSPNVTDIVSIAKACEAAGADGISLINTMLGMRIDLRRRIPVIANKMGGFSGPAIFPVAVRMVYQVANAVKIPVVGNGDLFSAEDVRRMREETACDGVMIARGAMGNPFLFSEIVAMDEGTPYTPPTDRERIDTALFHAADMVKRKGERTGLAEARKHMLWYCKGLRGAAAAREALTHAQSLDEIRAVLYALIGME